MSIKTYDVGFHGLMLEGDNGKYVRAADIAALLKYPEEWDTAAYPTLGHALHETLACARDSGKAANSDWQHLKAFGYAPGPYAAQCQACKMIFENLDKRAITCRPCAEKAFAAAKAADPQPVAFGKFVGLRHLPEGTKEFFGYLYGDAPKDKCDLYLHPDPRIAEYRKLLRESLSALDSFDDAWSTSRAAHIRAALKGGKP